MNTYCVETKIIMPKISVIIATYNRAHFVCDAIESVLNQILRDYEIIVVDDGSNDNTREALEKYGSRISYIYQENKGRAEARNTGIKIARGEYIAFLDDDDIWLPNKLEKQVDYLGSHTQIGLVHTFSEVINENGDFLEKETKERLRFYHKSMKIGYTYVGMSRLSVMFLSTVMIRRACFDKIGLFAPDIPAFEDWDFYLRFSLEYRIGTITETLVKFRMHPLHTTLDDFIWGRIKVSMKHLAMLESYSNFPYRGRICHNFYIHLANNYYIDSQLAIFRKYVLKTFKLNPFILFQSRLGLHFLVSLMPIRIIHMLRQLTRAQSSKTRPHPERIIPEEIFGGSLAAHLKRYDFVKQFCANKVVLDAACGVGYGSYYFAEVAKEVIGVDISEESIIYAKEHYQRENIQFKPMDVHNLEFCDKYFDVVCSFETLEHLDYPEKYLAEVKRVLNKGGIFIISTPHAKRTTSKPKRPYHKVEFSKNDFQGLLKKHFSNVEILGQRRLQSVFHYYLQRIDIFHLRAWLPNFVRRKICHALATRSWDETDIRDFVISKEGIKRANEFIGFCYK